MKSNVKLTELSPVLVAYVHPEQLRKVGSLDEADGLRFTCPRCGGHQILIWFADGAVPASMTPGPGRWKAEGNWLNDLSVVPSINTQVGNAEINTFGACGWHGFIREGYIEE